MGLFVTVIILLSLNPVSANSNSIKMSDTQSKIQNMYNELSNYDGEFVLFANSNDEYVSMKNSLNYVKAYDNLEILRIKTNFRDAYNLYQQYPGQLINAKYFNMASLPKPVKVDQLQLDNVVDHEVLNVKQLWDKGYNGTDVVVAVFDNGVNFLHSSLVGQEYATVNFNTYGGKEYEPCAEHGTPVSGTIAATGKLQNGSYNPDYRGMAFGSKIYAVQMGCAGRYLVGDFFGAFDYILAHNDTIKVVNTSWGSSWDYWEPVIDKLTRAGIILVGAAGNSGPDLFSIGGPAAAISAIGVGAITYGNLLAPFTSKGILNNLVYKPDVVAPGVNVITTSVDGTFAPTSGTSFSSPLTAGVVATLISAIKQNGLDYNAGVIKAALMKGATTYGFDEIEEGQGLVNAYASYNIIMNASRDGNLPELVEITPQHPGLLKALSMKYNKEMITKTPITIISSVPSKVNFEVTGDFASFVSIDNSNIDAGKYSQQVDMVVDTHGVTEGTYTGSIIATVGNDTSFTNYTLTVGPEPRGKILMDLGHTNNDAMGLTGYSGVNEGYMMEILKENNYWVNVTDDINSVNLSDYDILWMPEAMDKYIPDPDLPVLPNPLTDSEITTITDYVNNGGSLFVSFNGASYYNDTITNTLYHTGTDPVAINKLISQYGITTQSEEVDEETGIFTATVSNVTSITKGVGKISHSGNFLNVEGNAQVIASTVKGISVAIADIKDGGRVLVSDTNAWYSYTELSDKSTSNKKFAINAFNWLSSKTQVKLLEKHKNDNEIYGKIQVLENGNPANSIDINLLPNEFVNKTTITINNLGNGIFEFTCPISTDGYYNIQATYGSEYIRLSYMIDNNGPIFTAAEDNANMTGFPAGKTLYLSFNIIDISGIEGKESISVYLDGVELSDIPINYDKNRNSITIVIDKSLITNTTKHWYKLEIHAYDLLDHLSKTNYYFYVGDDAPEPLFSTEATNTEKSPFSTIFSIIAILMMSIIITPNYIKKSKVKI